MKLIYLSHWRFPSEKTMSPLIMRTCEEFSRQGFEVELWIPWRRNPGLKDADPYVYHQVKRNFTIRRLAALDFMGFLPSRIGFFLLLATFNISVFIYALVCNSKRRTVFFAHDERDVILLFLLRPAVFIEIHDFYKSSVGFINHWCFARARGLVVTNRLKMQTLNKEFGVAPDKMLHYPNAVDIAQFSQAITQAKAREILKLPPAETIILYTGHLFDWKGVDTLLESASFLPEEETVYFVGGTDDDLKSFKEKSRKFKNVIIVGRRRHAEIPWWLKAADVLILPNTAKDPVSKYETSPVKLFEYMAAARPIVASDIPSIRNVADENMVWFFEPDNAGSLARAVQNSLAQKTESVKKIERARNEVEKYSWEKRVGAISGFIKNTIKYGQ